MKPKDNCNKSKSGFTLIELLMIVIVIGVALSLFLPHAYRRLCTTSQFQRHGRCVSVVPPASAAIAAQLLIQQNTEETA